MLAMTLLTKSNYYFAHFLWNKLPVLAQKYLSFIWSYLYQTSASKYLIGFFIKRYQFNANQLSAYAPASGSSSYTSFQDFFTRRLVNNLKPTSDYISPCEGVVCCSDQVKNLNTVLVKGHNHSVRDIFGNIGSKISDSHYFINIFLHNHNYHRFHAPVSGTIKNINKIPGQLNFLRPWLYKKNQVNTPAFVNERVVLEIEDNNKNAWFISFVGGMGVGTINIYENFDIGSLINCGDELGLFLLGSTCCLAIPKVIKHFKYLEKIKAGDAL